MKQTNPVPLKRAGTKTLALASLAAILTLPLAATTAQAATPQNLSATIDGKKFESDDNGILYLLPVKGTLNLIASTKGGSAYPPPKELSDRLSINCSNFDSKPRKYSAKDFGTHGCEVRFIKGESRKPFGDPVAEYKIAGSDNVFEVTSVNGKVIEGKFSFEMVDIKSKAKMKISDGVFKAEDRQK